MDTISRKTQLQTQPFPAPSNNQTKTTGDNAPLPSVISRAIQTESHAQSLISSSTQTLTYEKQPTQVKKNTFIFIDDHSLFLFLDCSC